MTDRKLLSASETAKRLLDFYNGNPERWTQNTFYDSSGAYCLVGACLEMKISASSLIDALGGAVITFNDTAKSFAEIEKKLLEIANGPG